MTEEPDAVVPHVRICVGAAQVTGRSTMTVLIKNIFLIIKLGIEKNTFVCLIKSI